jgi:hypothetical protein
VLIGRGPESRLSNPRDDSDDNGDEDGYEALALS